MKKMLRHLFAITIVTLVATPATAFAGSINPEKESRQLDKTILQEIQRLKVQIQSAETEEGKFSSQILKPTLELGQFLQMTGHHQEAINEFERALHLIHQEHGVYSPRQLELLDLTISSYAAIGDFRAVDKRQLLRYRTAQKSFPPGDPKRIDAQVKMADWFRMTTRFDAALELYEESLKTLDNSNPHVEVHLLRSIAMTNYLSGRCCAASSLQIALDLSASNPDLGIEKARLAEDLIDMSILEGGNLPLHNTSFDSAYLGFSRQTQVVKMMASAHRSRQHSPSSEVFVNFGDPDGKSEPVSTIGNPVAMCQTTFDTLAPRSSSDTTVNISMTINDRGRPSGIKIQGDAPVRLKRYLKASLREAKFRFKTDENGTPTDTSIEFTQYFDEDTRVVTSRSAVKQWSRVLVAQGCQTRGMQRIAKVETQRD